VARTRGARNADYEEQRLALARKVRDRVLEEGGVQASLRELALSADTSVATLKHYFEDRDGVMAAVMESLRIDAAPYLARASVPVKGDVRASLGAFLSRVRTAWFKFGVGRMQAATLALGLSSRGVGPAYVNSILEPLLQTAESILRQHVERREIKPCNERFAALELLAPLVLGLLHQDSLSGANCRPLDVDDFLAAHLDAFLKAHSSNPANAIPRG